MGLYTAVEKNNIEKITKLLLAKKQKEPPENFLLYINNDHPFNETPLQLSLRQRKYKITLLLLEHGADPNYYYKTKDDDGDLAPLAPALLSGNKSVIKLLILYGATIPDIEFDKEDKFNKTFALDIQVLANKLKTKLQQALKAESKHDFVAAFLNYKVVASIWNEMGQDEPNIDFKQHYQRKAWLVCKSAVKCYEKLAGIEQQSQYQAGYNQLVLLKETLQSAVDINSIPPLPLNSSPKKSNNFFTGFGQCLRKLVRGKPTEGDSIILQPLLTEKVNANHRISPKI